MTLRMHIMKRIIAVPLLALVLSTMTSRADSFFQYGFWGPFLQIIDDQKSINGLRLDLFYGVNKDVNGLDLGIAHRNTGTGRGVQISIANETWGSQYGLQFGLVNLANENMSGLQLGAGYSHAGEQMKGVQMAVVSHVGSAVGVEFRGDLTGLQFGVISQVNEDLTGVQSGIIYGRTYGRMSGLQFGIANQAGHASGVQLGVVNIADSMKGIQIGLWNQIRSKETLKVFPVVNWSF